MSLFKKKKKRDEPHWFETIKENIKIAKASGQNYCFGYVPVCHEKLLMTLPNDISFELLMKIDNGSENEYYYKFTF